MRAVAILLVVASHAKFPYLSAGFIGVDMFFVLSGFLITGLLTTELSSTGKIAFLRFYHRRIKRLAPAMLAMILVTSISAYFLLSPVEQLFQIDGARYALFWVSNFFFAFSDYGYFDSGSGSNLFLHTWSLGVEEQFYLIWPLLLLALIRSSKKHDSQSTVIAVKKGLEYVVVAGFALSIVMTLVKAEWAFYLMPSRAWQFATGGLVFMYASTEGAETSSRLNRWLTSRWLGMTGILCIVAALLTVDGANYPGVWALLPTMGTALLLLGGATDDAAERTIYSVLTQPLMVWTGKLSYSWYLWHWPVLVLGFTVLAEPDGIDVGLLVLLSILVAVISYFLVEAPVRYSKRIESRAAATLVVFVMSSSLFLWFVIGWGEKATAYASSADQIKYSLAKHDAPKIYRDGCDDWYLSSRLHICGYGNQSSDNTVVLLGDSIGLQWFPAVDVLFTELGWKILVITKSSCPIIEKTFYYPRIGRDYVECDIWRDRALEWVQLNRPDLLLIGNNQAGFDGQDWIAGTTRVLEKVTEYVPTTVLIQPTKTVSFSGPECQSRYTWQRRFFTPLKNCTQPAHSSRNDDIKTWLQSAADRLDNVRLIDMNEVVCFEGKCAAEQDGFVVFRDAQHLTATFSSSLSEPLGKMLLPLIGAGGN